jgi:hypothetical protein
LDREGPFRYEYYENKFSLDADEGEVIETALSFKRGDFFEGQWNTNRQFRTGKGKCYMIDGSLQEGFWIKDMFQPVGRIIYFNGDLYEGQLIDGLAHGKGKYVYQDGIKYIG